VPANATLLINKLFIRLFLNYFLFFKRFSLNTCPLIFLFKSLTNIFRSVIIKRGWLKNKKGKNKKDKNKKGLFKKFFIRFFL